MRRKILDSSVLISFWRLRAKKSAEDEFIIDGRAWAKELINRYQTNAIVTPVYLEVVAGVSSANELKRTREYLSCFRVLDGGKVTALDWREAQRLAERIPRDGGKRQLGDCLIRAIGNRLKYDVETVDSRFPR